MSQLDCRGKFWITPERLIDVSADEHARIARAAMLNISADAMCEQIKLADIFKPLTKHQHSIYFGLGAKKEALDFLLGDYVHGHGSVSVDPRIYVIEKWGWIRTRENAFYAWEWDAATKKRLLHAHEYWEEQPKATYASWLDLISIRTGVKIGGSMKTVLGSRPEMAPC